MAVGEGEEEEIERVRVLFCTVGLRVFLERRERIFLVKRGSFK